MTADYYASSPPIKISTTCSCGGGERRDSPCLFYVSKTKVDRGYCKYAKSNGYVCDSPEARVDAAQKLIQALHERVVDRERGRG
jgi:hypothetical protein